MKAAGFCLLLSLLCAAQPYYESSLRINSASAALTFDACMGAYDSQLISFLRKQKIPATLFLTARWIKSNPAAASNLAADELFQIENHGEKHRPLVIGASIYSISGFKDEKEMLREISAGAEAVQKLTGRKPAFIRGATAVYDESALSLADKMNYRIGGFSIACGDAVKGASAETIAVSLRTVKAGDVVLLHMNHPEGNTLKALQSVLPIWREQSLSFEKLSAAELVPFERKLWGGSAGKIKDAD